MQWRGTVCQSTAELHIDTNTLTYCQFTVFDSPCCWTVPKRKINTQRKLQANATQKDWNEAGIQRPNLWPSCCKTGRLTLPPLCGPSVTLNWTGKCLVLYKNESIELSVTKCSHASFLCIKIKEKRWNKSFFLIYFFKCHFSMWSFALGTKSSRVKTSESSQLAQRGRMGRAWRGAPSGRWQPALLRPALPRCALPHRQQLTLCHTGMWRFSEERGKKKTTGHFHRAGQTLRLRRDTAR